VENKIKEITTNILRGVITKDEADNQLLKLINDINIFDKCDKCGGKMKNISKNSQQCEDCYNTLTWNI